MRAADNGLHARRHDREGEGERSTALRQQGHGGSTLVPWIDARRSPHGCLASSRWLTIYEQGETKWEDTRQRQVEAADGVEVEARSSAGYLRGIIAAGYRRGKAGSQQRLARRYAPVSWARLRGTHSVSPSMATSGGSTIGNRLVVGTEPSVMLRFVSWGRSRC